jgi:hypothetical protein
MPFGLTALHLFWGKAKLLRGSDVLVWRGTAIGLRPELVAKLRMQLLQRLQAFRAGCDLAGFDEGLGVDVLDLGNEVAVSDHGLERLYAPAIIASHKLTDGKDAATACIVGVRF